MAKKATLFVFSTLAASVTYPLYGEAAPGNIRPIVDEVHVKGGAGVVARGEGILTPRGVVTGITEEQAKLLRENDVFMLHQKNGYVTISADELDGDAAAALLDGRDNSAPLVPQDYDAAGVMRPVMAGSVDADATGSIAPTTTTKATSSKKR